MSDKTHSQISLKMILRNKNGEVLALKDPGSRNLEGLYDLPGGRIDGDEFENSFEEIFQREMHEEIGDIKMTSDYRAVAVGKCYNYSRAEQEKRDTPTIFVLFEGKYIEGDIKISDEHEDFKWIDLDSIQLEDYFNHGLLAGIKMYTGR
ncbi:NUDIX hydrolase [Patescibacteria group bacterium]